MVRVGVVFALFSLVLAVPVHAQQQPPPPPPQGTPLLPQDQPPPAQPQQPTYPPKPGQPYYPPQQGYPQQQPAYQPPAYQQPAYPQQPAYQPPPQQPAYQPPPQQPAYQPPPPAAQPAPRPAPTRSADAYENAAPRPRPAAPAAAAPAAPGEPSLADKLQVELVSYAKRAAMMSVPSGIALVAGGLLGAIASGVLSGVFIGAGISQGLLVANPLIILFVIPVVAMGSVAVGAVAYLIVRAISVGVVSMFFTGDANDLNDRLRNLRVMSVSDMFGHIGALVLSLSIVGFGGLLGMFTMSLVGLGSFAYALMKPPEGGALMPPAFYDPRLPVFPLFMLLGMGSAGMLGIGLFVTVALAHLDLPLSASITQPLVFGDADTSAPPPQ